MTTQNISFNKVLCLTTNKNNMKIKQIINKIYNQNLNYKAQHLIKMKLKKIILIMIIKKVIIQLKIQ